MLKLKWLAQGLLGVVLFLGLFFGSGMEATISEAESLPVETESYGSVTTWEDPESIVDDYEEQADIAAVNERNQAIRSKMKLQIAGTVLTEDDDNTTVEDKVVATHAEMPDTYISKQTEQASAPVVEDIEQPVAAEPIIVEEAPVEVPVEVTPVEAAPSHYMVAPGVGFVGSEMRAMSYTPWYPNWQPTRDANEYSADVQWFID